MSAKSLMNQSVIVRPQGSYNPDGTEVVGSGTTERWRIQPKSKTIFSPRGAVDRGSLLTLDAIGYAPPDTVANIDAKITHNNLSYKVYALYPVPGGNGQTDHVKVQLIRWQA